MRISANSNVFLDKSISMRKFNARAPDFASVLRAQHASAKAERAADMTEAIEALDRALEKARENEPPKLSEAQLDWLRGRHDIRDMEIDCNSDIYIRADGATVTTPLGAPIMSEAHGRLLDDLHGLRLLSDRDMEILIDEVRFGRAVSLYEGAIIKKVEDLPFWETFFNSWLNPNWTSDIVGFHRAMAGKHLENYEILVRGNRNWNFLGQSHLPPNNEWYRESAEAHYRLANILAQIFG